MVKIEEENQILRNEVYKLKKQSTVYAEQKNRRVPQ